jgi:hypothetical protein
VGGGNDEPAIEGGGVLVGLVVVVEGGGVSGGGVAAATEAGASSAIAVAFSITNTLSNVSQWKRDRSCRFQLTLANSSCECVPRLGMFDLDVVVCREREHLAHPLVEAFNFAAAVLTTC